MLYCGVGALRKSGRRKLERVESKSKLPALQTLRDMWLPAGHAANFRVGEFRSPSS